MQETRGKIQRGGWGVAVLRCSLFFGWGCSLRARMFDRALLRTAADIWQKEQRRDFFFKEEDKRRLGKKCTGGHAPVEVVVCAVGRVVMLPHCGDDCAIYCLAGAGD